MPLHSHGSRSHTPRGTASVLETSCILIQTCRLSSRIPSLTQATLSPVNAPSKDIIFDLQVSKNGEEMLHWVLKGACPPKLQPMQRVKFYRSCSYCTEPSYVGVHIVVLMGSTRCSRLRVSTHSTLCIVFVTNLDLA